MTASEAGSSDDSAASDGQNLPEPLAQGREKRATAGNRLRVLLDQEFEAEETFREVEDDVEFVSDDNGAGEDVEISSSSSSDGEDGEDDGEERIQREQPKKRRAAAAFIPTVRKRGPAVAKSATLSVSKSHGNQTAYNAGRKSSRSLTVQSTQSMTERWREAEARRAKTVVPQKPRDREMTQAERMAEALVTEQRNIQSLHRLTELEETRREKQRLALNRKRKVFEPLVRTLSCAVIERLEQSGSISNKEEAMSIDTGEMDSERKNHDEHAVGTSGNLVRPTLLAAVTAECKDTVKLEHEKDFNHEPSPVETNNTKLVEHLTTPPHQNGMESTRETHTCKNHSAHPVTNSGNGDGDNKLEVSDDISPSEADNNIAQHADFMKTDRSLLSAAQDELKTKALHTDAPSMAARDIHMHGSSPSDGDKCNSQTYPVSRLEQTVLTFVNLVPSFPNRDLQRELLFGKHATAKPAKPRRVICPYTGQFARYRDPKTGACYSNLKAYQVIQDVINGAYEWSELLGVYVGPIVHVPAAGVPSWFAQDCRPIIE